MKLSEKQKQLVLNNQRLVHYFVKKSGVTLNDYDDMASIGMIGLIKAAQTFDESKNVKFSSYASRCIQNEIFMHFRKEKHANYISLDEAIGDDGEGNELTLSHLLSAKDFAEDILMKQECISAINLVLNVLNSKQRLIMLYKIAGLTQDFIAKIFNISRSYVSKLEYSSIAIIKSYLSTTKQFKEVFSMSIVGDSYKISFSSRDVPHFNKIFSLLLQNLTSTEALPDFVVNCNHERIIIQIPAHPESFSFIAQIIKEIDDYSIKYTSVQTSSDTNCGSLPKVKSDFPDKNINAIKQTSSSQVVNNFVVNSEDILDESATDEENESDIIAEDLDTPSVEEEMLQTTQEVQTNKDKSKKGDISNKVKDYIWGLDSFTTKELAQNFPDIKYGTIAWILNLEKQKGSITSAGRGKFIVNKTENT